MRDESKNGGRQGTRWKSRYARALEALRLFNRVDGQQLIELCAGRRSTIIEDAYLNKNKRLAYSMLSGFPCREGARKSDRVAHEMIRHRTYKRYKDFNEHSLADSLGALPGKDESDQYSEDQFSNGLDDLSDKE